MNVNEFKTAITDVIVEFDSSSNSIPPAEKAALLATLNSRGFSAHVSRLIINETEAECQAVLAAAPGAFDPTLVVGPAKLRVQKKLVEKLVARYDLATHAIDPAARQQAVADLKEIGYTATDAVAMVSTAFTIADQEVQSNGGSVAPDAARCAAAVVALQSAGALHHPMFNLHFAMPRAIAGAPRAAWGAIRSAWSNKAIAVLFSLMAIIYVAVFAPASFKVLSATTVPGMILSWTLVVAFALTFVVTVIAAFRGARASWTTPVACGSLFGALFLGGAMVYSPSIPDFTIPPVVDRVEEFGLRVSTLEGEVGSIKDGLEKVEGKVTELASSRPSTTPTGGGGVTTSLPRPTLAGRPLSDLDILVGTQGTRASAWALVGLIKREWGLSETLKSSDIARLKAWIRSDSPEAAELRKKWESGEISQFDVNARTLALLRIAGVKDVKGDGTLVPFHPEDADVISQNLAKIGW
ncbi:MAG TPA: hypothetical protein PKA63_04300 [Oligoflexia bacterium]|nr:hypothetical protein [Oligoflexia bacterium]HMP47871.1 hypothetical protein [Oligoflexia bacterium]